jgi:sporulation protein YlmC with PRC-barrel domain
MVVSGAQNLTEALLSGQKVLGYKVENPRGEGLGRVEDIMLRVEGGQVAYVVVSFGRVLSLRNKLFAFPWSALHVDSPKKKIILNLDRQTLAKARGLDKDQWPSSADSSWETRVPLPSPAAPAVLERAIASGTPGLLGEVPRQEARPLVESPPIGETASAKNRLEQWGKSWQSHGLDRT